MDEYDKHREDCRFKFAPHQRRRKMIKAEFLDLGPHNGMREPDPTGSYWAFTVSDLWQPGDEAQSLTFLVPAHQLPTAHAQAEKEAAVAAEREAIAYEICEMEQHDAAQHDWGDGEWLAKRIASAIRARANTDAPAARDAQVRAKALREAAKECEPFGYDGVGDRMCKTECQRRILALIPADQEGDE